MDAIGKELEANMVILDEEPWAQNVLGTCQGFQNRDQCLRLLQSLFRSRIGVRRYG
jgi:hypothetical protein